MAPWIRLMPVAFPLPTLEESCRRSYSDFLWQCSELPWRQLRRPKSPSPTMVAREYSPLRPTGTVSSTVAQRAATARMTATLTGFKRSTCVRARHGGSRRASYPRVEARSPPDLSKCAVGGAGRQRQLQFGRGSSPTGVAAGLYPHKRPLGKCLACHGGPKSAAG